jgi:hypothetical protein
MLKREQKGKMSNPGKARKKFIRLAVVFLLFVLIRFFYFFVPELRECACACVRSFFVYVYVCVCVCVCVKRKGETNSTTYINPSTRKPKKHGTHANKQNSK